METLQKKIPSKIFRKTHHLKDIRDKKLIILRQVSFLLMSFMIR